MVLEAQDALLVLFTFLQVAAAAVLWNATSIRRVARHMLSLFFVVNAAMTGLLWIVDVPGGPLTSDSAGWLHQIRLQLDAFSVWPLAAFAVAAAWSHPRAKVVAWSLLAIGLVVFVPAVLYHVVLALDRVDTSLGFIVSNLTSPSTGPIGFIWQSALFYPAAAAVILTLSRRSDALAWVALAMIPRSAYWISYSVVLAMGDPAHLVGNYYALGIFLSAPFVAWGLVRMLQRRHLPFALVAAAPAIGMLIYFAEVAESRDVVRIYQTNFNLIVNLTTLGFFRPLLAVGGLHRRAMTHLLSFSVAATAATMLTAELFLTTLASAGAKLLAVASGLFLLVLLETRSPLPVDVESLHRLAPGTQVGRWRIRRLLGQSPLAEVYLGEQGRGKNRRQAALKLPRAANADAASWRTEAESMRRVHHPHVVALEGFVETPAGPCLVMEYLEGETLQERLTRGALAHSELEQLGDQLLSAVQALHDAGVVHRDVKPSNIMLTPHGAKLMDFGVARQIDEDATMSGMWTLPVPVGTPAYMSPEQARGEPVDAQSDLFSAAVVLHEARTGRPLIPAHMSGGQSLHARATYQQPPVDMEPWKTWNQTALAPSPQKRFPTSADMADAWKSAWQTL